jgi:hypothetical protein
VIGCRTRSGFDLFVNEDWPLIEFADED